MGFTRFYKGVDMMYEVRDVSRLTHTDLYEPRGQEPDGFMLHTTDGRNSQGWLQGVVS